MTRVAPHGFLRVAAGSPRLRVADPDYNVGEILGLVREAASRGAQVLVLPELALTGYTAADLFFSLTTLVAGAERALARLLAETASLPMVIVLGLPVASDSQLFNTAAVLQAGRLLGVVPKSFLPGYKEYYEERWFSSSREALRDELRLAGQTVPFGIDLLFAVDGEPGAWRSARTSGCRCRRAVITPSRARRCS
jgi:NAD+ synthase (glutamine-hydrolysing)